MGGGREGKIRFLEDQSDASCHVIMRKKYGLQSMFDRNKNTPIIVY